MEKLKRLRTGAAYHSNRILSHAESDMREMADAGMDIVVHMYTHNDMERHTSVVKDIIKASEAEGLDVWLDNWGIGGAPGDKCHFLAYHPEAHSYYGDGNMHPYQICLNSPVYRDFVKEWAYKSAELGVKTVFWDEPIIPEPKIKGTDDFHAACTCPTCRALFREKFGHDMPNVLDAEVSAFRNDTMIDFHRFMTDYAHSLGLKNTICFQPYQLPGMKQQTEKEKLLNFSLKDICAMPNIDSIGTDPYWYYVNDDPYWYNYNAAKICIDTASKHGKDHHLWLQSYHAPAGREEEIIEAAEGLYDAGARTIIAWSFHSAESNDYRSNRWRHSWHATKEAFRRLRDMDRDRIHAENKKNTEQNHILF